MNADGTISVPADIQPTATGTPIGIVFDYDGRVTDALIGSGAGASSQCFSNAVFGGADNYGAFATYQHALIVINGQCALQSSEINDVQYRLVRVIGSVLGLGWSQVNPNVLTRTPAPTSDDYAGFPVMHFTDHFNCVPITLCYPNPYQLAMDDVAALSRLYPVTAQNQSNFPGKQIFSAATARIHGSVWFTDSVGNRTQAMQGVNVVARWIDPGDWSAVAQVCRRVGIRFFYSRATRAIPSLAPMTRWEILFPNGGRTAKPWKASSTLPDCNCQTAAAHNIS